MAIATEDYARLSSAHVEAKNVNYTLYVVAFVVVHSAVWTSYAVMSREGALHQDMIEAWAWGQGFQLGYSKHPPFWAWIAGAWFEVFPKSNWAFHLLATLNSAIAIIGVWKLSEIFTTDRHYRVASVTLLLMIPYFTVHAHQWNANFALLALWPWTTYFFVRSMEHCKLSDAVAFGALTAAAMLSKYYSGVLLVSLMVASFCHPNWRRYYGSSSPYLTMAIFLALVAPHVWWLVHYEFPPMRYLETRTAFSAAKTYGSIVAFVFSPLAICAAPIGIVAGSRMFRGRSNSADGPSLFLVVLAIAPLALTVLIGVVQHVRISVNFSTPAWFLTPILLLLWLRPWSDHVARTAVIAAAIFTAALLMASPAIRQYAPQTRMVPLRLAQESARIWRDTMHTPLAAVAGEYSADIAFYSNDRTEVLASPRSDDTLIVCSMSDVACQSRALAVGNTAVHSALGFDLYLPALRTE
jgi:4-amino-4-deoxy-L-arabinose transferase-like glycosyltransferase